jgi:hypothetical protein
VRAVTTILHGGQIAREAVRAQFVVVRMWLGGRLR